MEIIKSNKSIFLIMTVCSLQLDQYLYHSRISISTVAIVGFTSDAYSVSEGSGLIDNRICAYVFTPDMRCPVDVAFNLSLLVYDRTAGKISA